MLMICNRISGTRPMMATVTITTTASERSGASAVKAPARQPKRAALEMTSACKGPGENPAARPNMIPRIA